MGQLWSDESRFRRWLEVELAVCEVLAEQGGIPPEAMRTIRERARFDVAEIHEIELNVKHDVIAFLTSVANAVGPESRFIHMGLTSSDVLDTALALQLGEAADRIIAGVESLMAVLRERAFEHRMTVMVGRTHGIHAEPVTLGLKFALWHAEMERNLVRLRAARETVRVGKLSGAVGTFAHLEPEVEEEVCRRLGLTPAPIATQVLQRDRHAEYLCALAVTACSIEKFATEIRNLQRTDIREVEEPFTKGQKGSSAMPHKRNPVGCENLTGLARIVRADAVAAMENVALWHERDISHSSVERVILPDATILLDYMLARFTGIVTGLVVYPERMRENLVRMKGLIFSQALLLGLVDAGATREQAYDWVQRSAMKVWETGEEFHALVARDPDIAAILPAERIAACFEMSRYLRHVDTLFRRVFKDARRSE
jgi:adenylosuccinate lyase